MSPPSTTSSPHVYSRRWQRDPRLYPSPSNWDITLNRQGGKGSIPHTPPQNDFFFFNLLPPPLQHAALLITVLISVYMEEDISSGGVSETLPVSCDSGTLPSARSLFILPLVSLLFSGGGGAGACGSIQSVRRQWHFVPLLLLFFCPLSTRIPKLLSNDIQCALNGEELLP